MESRDEPVIETRECEGLESEIDSLIKDDYRLDMIMPADAPREALLSKGNVQVRLTTNPKSKIQNPKSTGRAGMEYRDLIPDRLDGNLIASHIRINEPGPVADYVHYHKIRFQMIFCKTGSIRVVYEDQGEPFVLNAGDCILQPPEIRHRVLESSAGAEVVEISSPAEHETWVEHEITLPTAKVDRNRDFGGQIFVRSLASEAIWTGEGAERRETKIEEASAGFADVRVIRLKEHGTTDFSGNSFIFILSGEVEEKENRLAEGDSILLPAGNAFSIKASTDAELLYVELKELTFSS